MARNLWWWWALAMCAVAVMSAGGVQGSSVGWMSSGTVGQFDLEFAMESEISRRILATSKYISYGALQKNSVPCSRRGASYYNCQKGAQSNPYSRGCSNIARCRT